MAVFRRKSGLFWLGSVLFGGEGFRVKNRAKTEKTGGRAAGLARFWCKKGSLFARKFYFGVLAESGRRVAVTHRE